MARGRLLRPNDCTPLFYRSSAGASSSPARGLQKSGKPRQEVVGPGRLDLVRTEAPGNSRDPSAAGAGGVDIDGCIPDEERPFGRDAELLREPSVEVALELSRGWLAQPPTEHAGYLELLEKTPEVMAAFLTFAPEAQAAIARHTIRTAEGMATVVERSDDEGLLRLSNVQDLRDYCYIVAGIVGEMLTDLFLLGSSAVGSVANYLRERASLFGEGLQLVNILKDSSTDATEGRNYLPARVDREEVFALARRDLAAAAEYTLAVQRAGGPSGVVLFTGLPLELAWATLDRVERDGPGAKLTRPEVFAIHQRLLDAVKAGLPAVKPPDEVS